MMNGWVLYFFITSTFTFFMSTFWLNSGGNLVCLSSFASTFVAMLVSDGGDLTGGRKNPLRFEITELH